MKVLKYPTIDDLHRDQQKLIRDNYDDWNLTTGRVGKGKSKWARKNARKLDPTFNLDRIHFREEPFWDQYWSLEPGQCIILDEFKGHRRAAMRGERIEFLEDLKRVRARRVHAWVVYDRVSNIDRELLTDRNAYWHHLERRGNVQVRQPRTQLMFTMDAQPIEPTDYPVVGDFDFTPWEPAGVEAAYDAKKERETQMRRRLEAGESAPQWDKPDLHLAEIARARLGL